MNHDQLDARPTPPIPASDVARPQRPETRPSSEASTETGMPFDGQGVKIGDYEIRQPIGQGGMGTVYLAYDCGLGREVALKVIRPEIVQGATVGSATPGSVTLDRFAREARALASLSHPNLLAIHAIGRAEVLGNLPYFVMELIRGETLAARLRAQGPQPCEEVLRIGGQVLSALACVHAAGITHRDLKPANIMIRQEDARVVLMDFGIAKVESAQGLTTEGLALGTPEYMSPEQAEGAIVDPRSDLYSFGILLYEMLVGRVPFQGKSAFSILRQQVEADPERPSACGVPCPPALEAVILKCLQKDPAQRYASARELAGALCEVQATPERADFQTPSNQEATGLATQPTLAQGPPPGSAVQSPETQDSGVVRPQRKAQPLWLVALVLLPVIVGMSVFGWWMTRSDRAKSEATPGPASAEKIPTVPDRWSPEKIRAIDDGILNRSDGSTVRGKLLAIEPQADGGFEVTLWVDGKIVRERLQPGFAVDWRALRPGKER